jgi:histone H3/H4
MNVSDARRICEKHIDNIQNNPLYAYGGIQADEFDKFTLTDDAVNSLTQYVQGYVKRVLVQAKSAAQQSSRKRVSARHLQMVLSLRGHNDPLYVRCVSDIVCPTTSDAVCPPVSDTATVTVSDTATVALVPEITQNHADASIEL